MPPTGAPIGGNFRSHIVSANSLAPPTPVAFRSVINGGGGGGVGGGGGGGGNNVVATDNGGLLSGNVDGVMNNVNSFDGVDTKPVIQAAALAGYSGMSGESGKINKTTS